MGGLAPSALRKHIDSGQLDPVYLVRGTDEYEKDEIVETFESVVEEELRPFNVDRFDGMDAASKPVKVSQKKIFEFIDGLLQKTGKIGEYDQKI